jgi:CubicO group peptidase (beta-lactamase class C family)
MKKETELKTGYMGMPELLLPDRKPRKLQTTDFVQDAGVVAPQVLDKLDMYLQKNIAEGVFPGCRVLAAKDGQIFYDKSFGYFTYEKKNPVTAQTLYDVASLTKVLATTLAIMKLYDDKKIQLDKTLGDYLPQYRGTDKGSLVIRDLLLHQAGLKSWIPFYKETLDSATGLLLQAYYSNHKDSNYTLEIAKDIYGARHLPDTVWARIKSSPIENKGHYVYSDLDFYFLAAVVAQVAQMPLEKYVQDNFYQPMGLKNILFNPLTKYNRNHIAPTEQDLFFRRQLIQGYVHDPGAALMGGVAGHAGLFATAGDAAVIFQMLLNNGVYNGKQYLQGQTVQLFTAYNSSSSRRGLGFDKPQPDINDSGPAASRCSGYTFGHQGFTGTCAWADPAQGIIFIFLSNRVYPSAENNQLNRLHVRDTIQDMIYESLGIPVNKNRPAVKVKQLRSGSNLFF